MTSRVFIEARNLSHVYDGGIRALSSIDLQIKRNEFLALVGANGSGKTTLVKHFNGLLKPTLGTVHIDGLNTRDTGVARLARLVGFVFQNPDHQIFAHSVWEETIFGMKQLDLPEQEIAERASESLDAVGLYDFRERHPRELSRGQRQRLATASVLAVETEVLVLDEPTTGQDFRARRQIMDIATDLHARGRTIIIVTHDMALVAEYCTRAIVMLEGRLLLDSPPAKLFENPGVLAEAGLRPPPVVEIAQKLRQFGLTSNALTLDELEEALTSEIIKCG